MIKRTYCRLVAGVILLLCVLSLGVSVSDPAQPAFADGGYGKLFGWGKTVSQTEPRVKVYIGGFPLGFSLKIDGVMVEEVGTVDTQAGSVRAQTDLQKGDIIVTAAGTSVHCADDLDNAANVGNGARIPLTIRRGDDSLDAWIQPLKEALTGRFRLGVWVKDRINGIGTVSFVRADKRFVALGHPISIGKYRVPVCGGDVYSCEIIGITKGRRGQPGEMKGMLNNTVLGKIADNTEYGVYGSLERLPKRELYDLSGRECVTCGKAQLYTTVDDKPDFYDIEIVRAMGQNKRSDKSMVIRVTDKRLIEKTGGIVQGMSGSPIIQNHAIVGAVTHVFVNDPLKGYGIYADWLCE